MEAQPSNVHRIDVTLAYVVLFGNIPHLNGFKHKAGESNLMKANILDPTGGASYHFAARAGQGELYSWRQGNMQILEEQRAFAPHHRTPGMLVLGKRWDTTGAPFFKCTTWSVVGPLGFMATLLIAWILYPQDVGYDITTHAVSALGNWRVSGNGSIVFATGLLWFASWTAIDSRHNDPRLIPLSFNRRQMLSRAASAALAAGSAGVGLFGDVPGVSLAPGVSMKDVHAAFALLFFTSAFLLQFSRASSIIGRLGARPGPKESIRCLVSLLLMGICTASFAGMLVESYKCLVAAPWLAGGAWKSTWSFWEWHFIIGHILIELILPRRSADPGKIPREEVWGAIR